MTAEKSILSFVLSTLLAGCATHSPLLTEVPPEFSTQPSNGTKIQSAVDVDPYLIAVEVPFAVDPKAINRFNEVFVTRQLTAVGEPVETGELAIDNNAGQDSLGKTIYYSMELYSYLSNRLGAEKVYVHPLKITLNDSGNLYFQEVRPKPPAILTLGFFAYNSPKGTYYGAPKTAGNRITPVLTLKTSPRALPNTNGWIVNNEHLLDTSFSEGVLSEQTGQALSFYDVISDPTRFGDIERYPKTRAEHAYSHSDIGARYMVWPLISYEMDGKIMFGDVPKLSKATEGLDLEDESISFLQPGSETLHQHAINQKFQWTEYLDAIGNVIEAAGQTINPRDAAWESWTNYVDQFDPGLAGALTAPAAATDELMARKVNTVKLFFQTEKKLYHDQTEAIFESVYLGDYGTAMRSQLTTEYQAWLDIKAANTRNTALAIGLSLVTAGIGAPVAALMPVANALDKSLRNLQNELFSSISNTYENAQHEMRTYEINVMGQRHELTTSSSEDLRQKMRAIYEVTFVE